jgi:hypothetical protein
MPKKSTKPVTKKAAKPAARVVTSKTSKSSARSTQESRNKFVAGAVLVAAALVAITLGLLTYTNNKDTTASMSKKDQAHGAMFLQSTDGNAVKAGSTITVQLMENSGNDPVNAVQSAVTYPEQKLEFVSVKSGEAFPQEAATDSATKGLVRIARSIKPQTPPVQGAKPIATLEFKVLEDAQGPIQLNIDQATSLLVRSTDNQNILAPSGNSTLEIK